MTDFTKYPEQRRDIQDSYEMGVAGTVENVPGAGRIMSVRGTGTEDLELPIMNFGYGFTLPPNSNAEVMMVSMGSDTNNKVAIPQLGRDMQYQWPEGTGGIQNPMDPSKRIEFSGGDTHHTDGVHAFGPNKELVVTVSGGSVTLAISGDLTINAGNIQINSGTLMHNAKNIGDSHTHGGVDTGGGNTAVPN